MKIPKQLKVGGHTIKVTLDDGDKEECGSYDVFKNEITISPKLPKSQQEATLIHEIFHVLNTTFENGHNFSHALLDSLSEQFYQVLSDNKLLK